MNVLSHWKGAEIRYPRQYAWAPTARTHVMNRKLCCHPKRWKTVGRLHNHPRFWLAFWSARNAPSRMILRAGCRLLSETKITENAAWPCKAIALSPEGVPWPRMAQIRDTAWNSRDAGCFRQTVKYAAMAAEAWPAVCRGTTER